MLWTGKLCAAHATTTVSLAISTPTLACVQIGGLHVFTAVRFFIDVWSASERVLTMFVRNLADASRCPSITTLPSFARISQKHHTSLSKDLIRASLGFICRWLFGSSILFFAGSLSILSNRSELSGRSSEDLLNCGDNCIYACWFYGSLFDTACKYLLFNSDRPK